MKDHLLDPLYSTNYYYKHFWGWGILHLFAPFGRVYLGNRDKGHLLTHYHTLSQNNQKIKKIKKKKCA